MAYLVECQKGALDISLVHVVLYDMIPTDDRVHGPTAISGQIHGGLQVSLRQTSPHGFGEFGGVGEGKSIKQGAILWYPVSWWGRAGRGGVRGGGEGSVGAA